jgi:transposase
MNKKYRVRLTPEERARAEQVVRLGRAAAATQTRARILLKVDSAEGSPAWPDATTAEALDVSVATVERVRKRFVTEGLEATIRRQPTTRPPQWKLDGAQEAHLVALACSDPPAGAERWTLALLATKLVELRVVDSIARDTVRVALKKTKSSRG